VLLLQLCPQGLFTVDSVAASVFHAEKGLWFCVCYLVDDVVEGLSDWNATVGGLVYRARRSSCISPGPDQKLQSILAGAKRVSKF
jgi:hypothetical protein